MSRTINLVAGAALLLTLGTFGLASAQSADWSESKQLREAYGLPSGFTAAQLKSAAGRAEVLSYETKYGLRPGWKEAQFCQAAGTSGVAYLRVGYNLMPGFNEQDYAQGYANLQVNLLIKQYNLPPNFTEEQLRQAVGQDRVDHAGVFETGWQKHAPFSGADFAAAAGPHAAREIANKYQLSDRWDYRELVEAAGPEVAASTAGRHGFGKKDSHAQIVEAIGETALKEYANVYRLPEYFTPVELIWALGDNEIRFYREGVFHDPGAVVDESWLIAQYKARALSNFLYEYPFAGPKFDEASLISAIGEEECNALRDKYGLEPGFSEADVAEASGASKVAKIRREYALPKDFNEDDLLVAEKRRGTCSQWSSVESCH